MTGQRIVRWSCALVARTFVRTDVVFQQRAMAYFNGLEDISNKGLYGSPPGEARLALSVTRGAWLFLNAGSRERQPGSETGASTGDVQVLRAMKVGARGYLLKTLLDKELLETIRAVHSGKRCSRQKHPMNLPSTPPAMP